MDCKEWLAERLGKRGTEIPCDLIREEAKTAGYTRKQLKAARLELGVKQSTGLKAERTQKCGSGFYPQRRK